MRAEIPAKFRYLFRAARYKVAWGGRGSAKSWSYARALVLQGAQRPLRWLCAREHQLSIQQSVHKLLADQIRALGLGWMYTVQQASITGRNGTEITFAGLRHNVDSIKSLESYDGVWVEEAQSTSKHSWEVLIPTLRKDGSEIWATFNPDLETDDTYQRFVVHPPPGAVVVKVGWRDNPWFPQVLRDEMDHLKSVDEASYNHVWEGHCRSSAVGAIYEKELAAAESENRITRVPYDAAKPVDTFWDLGFGDATSIWMAQSVGREYHVIDFEEGSGFPLEYYMRKLQERPYIWGVNWLPWDAKAKELGSGRSIEEIIRAQGRQVQIVPRLTVADGINAARTVMRQCWFDREKCAEGLQSLRHYRYQRDEAGEITKREPVHDWASHAADAFRYLAVAIQTPQREHREWVHQYDIAVSGDNAWMA